MDNNRIILIVIIAVVVTILILFVLPMATMVWMTETSEQTAINAEQKTNEVLCNTYSCMTDKDCEVDPCGDNAECVGGFCKIN